MLRSLYIQNYALIEKLDISFSSGFSVITGETGAGKSIILGAIGLLLGQRADVKAIRVGASKCIIEARFDISAYGMQPFFEENELEYEEECILRREVSASGKSRAFINDTPASLAQMKELGEQLIDVHSQHQNLLLNKEGFQLNVLTSCRITKRPCLLTSISLEHGSRHSRIWRPLLLVPIRISRTKTISVSNWNSWKRHTCLLASRRSWSKRQIR